MDSRKELSTIQLSVVLGVSRQSIHAWIKSGLPVARKELGRGGGNNFFDFNQVVIWLQENKKKVRQIFHST